MLHVSGGRLILSSGYAVSFRGLHFSRFVLPVHRLWRESTAQNIVNLAPKSVQPYLRLMRVDKPIGTWLLYFPCTWSIALAAPPGHLPDARMLFLFGTGSFLMRSAGCIINDMWDKDFDGKVERTKLRPLASGAVTTTQATVLLAGLLGASASILLQLNWLSVFTGICSLALVVSYPLAKRYTYWPQVVLGVTLNWGVLLAWFHLLPKFPEFTCIVPLYIANVCHTIISDTIYSHQDKADDIIIGVKSTALRFGDQTKLWLGGFSTLMISNLTLVGYISDQIWPYYLAVGGTAVHLAWQVGAVNTNNGEDCWRKFRSNQQIGIFFFLGIVLSNLLKETPKKKWEDNLIIDDV